MFTGQRGSSVRPIMTGKKTSGRLRQARSARKTIVQRERESPSWLMAYDTSRSC